MVRIRVGSESGSVKVRTRVRFRVRHWFRSMFVSVSQLSICGRVWDRG